MILSHRSRLAALILCWLIQPSFGQVAPATQPVRTYRGIVLSPEQKAIAGAEITFIVRQNEQSDFSFGGKAVTDAQGEFHFTSDAEGVESFVAATGFGIAPVQMATADNGLAKTVLTPATTLRAQFVDSDNKPVPGLHVAFSMIGNRSAFAFVSLPESIQKQYEQVTDAQGVCEIPNLARGNSVRLAVRDDRFAQLTVDSDAILNDADMNDVGRIVLIPAATISGKVIFGDSGQPAAGVRVSAQAVRGGGGGAGVTDEQGNYTLKQLDSGEFNVALDQRAPWGQRYVAVAHEKLMAHAGDHLNDINFVLSTTFGTVVGKAIVKETGKPVADMYIGVYGPAHPKSGGWVQSGMTGPDGTFIARVPPGAQYVYIASQPPAGLISPAQTSSTVMVQADQTLEVNFEFSQSPFPPVTGRVVDSAGKPVAKAVILATHDGQNDFDGMARGISGVDGTFSIPGIPNGAKIRASSGDLRTGQDLIVGDAARDLTLTLRAIEPASALVRVVGSDGKPLAGVKLVLGKEEQMGRGFALGEDKVEKSAADGTFVFKSLMPDATYHVTAGGNGFTESSAKLALTEGKQSEVRLVVEPANSFVGGVVVDAKGEPVADIQVYARDGDRRPVKSDSKGRFRFDNVAANASMTVYTTTEVGLGEQISIQAGHDDAVIVYVPHAAKYPFGTRVGP